MEKCIVCLQPSEQLSRGGGGGGVCKDCEEEFQNDTSSQNEQLEPDNPPSNTLEPKKIEIEDSLNWAGSILFWIGVVIIVLSFFSSLISESIIPFLIGVGSMLSLWISSIVLQAIGKIIELLNDIKGKKEEN